MPAKSPWGRPPERDPGRDRPPSRPSGGGSGRPGGDGPQPPQFDFDRWLRQTQRKFEAMFGGARNEQRLVMAFFGIFLAAWLVSGVYRVNSDELGVVLRFGQYHRTTAPGLNYHLPYPIEQVMIPSVTSVNRVEIGDRNAASDNPSIRTAKLRAESSRLPQNSEGLTLTGDRNIVDIGFEVQWKIDGTRPEKYLFNVRDPSATVHAVAEAAMREVIGRNKLDDILTTAQSQIADDARQIMQQTLNAYDAGIEITAVNLSRPDVPQPVIDEFQDVKRAQQDKQTAFAVAEGYRNEIVPRAKGEAAQMIQQAEAYKMQVVADAKGDAARFSQVYEQYRQAKDVTRRRIYLETMEEIFKGMPKVIVEQKGGMVQLLPVPMRGALATGAAQAAAPTASTAAPAAATPPPAGR
jgi:membrane protease subunit HflK